MRSLLAALVGSLVLAASAGASSIAYVKDGNVWLSSPDGKKGYQLTTGGRWSSPSQADDGTIAAVQGTVLHRFTRSGRVIGKPFPALGGDTNISPGGDRDRTFGPFDPKISPNGRQIAYWFTINTNSFDSGCNCVHFHYEDYTTSTPSDHFVGGPEVSVRARIDPSWINNNRVLAFNSDLGPVSVATWVPGGDFHNDQWWFEEFEALTKDGELSPDGSKLVVTAATGGALSPYDRLWFYSTNGPAFVGNPPFDNLDENRAVPPAPTARCQNVRDSEAHSPTWSPSSGQLAYVDKDGIWVEQVPADLGDCSGLGNERLVIAGGSDPDWGPANLNLAQRPGALRVRKFRVRPRVASARRGATLLMSLSKASRVTVTLRRGTKTARKRSFKGKRGGNRFGLRLRGLPPGRYRLTAVAHTRAGSASVPARAKLRVTR